MSLAHTIGLLLLLANPQFPAMQSAVLFQSPDNSPPQTQSQQPSPEQPAVSEQLSSKPENSQQTSDSKPISDTQKPKAPPATKTATKPSKKKTSKHSAPATSNGLQITVVHNGGASDSQGRISSGNQQASEHLKNTNTQLAATTTNLQAISGKQLDSTQQDMLKQIKNYMRQSKDATGAGDLQGAENLAIKAHLLSEELIKH